MGRTYKGTIFIELSDFWTFIYTTQSTNTIDNVLEPHSGKLEIRFNKTDIEIHVKENVLVVIDQLDLWNFVTAHYVPNSEDEIFCGVPKVKEEDLEIEFYATSGSLEDYPDFYKMIEDEWEALSS